ncbi:MAG: hypothetical protein HOY75_05610 [Streptomyces sp.]|nr:hypothetical protein [Streptomyces sp.]
MVTGHPDLVDVAQVCASDVVTNVLQHTKVPDMSVDVTIRDDRVIVGVQDDDPRGHPEVADSNRMGSGCGSSSVSPNALDG